MCILVLLDRPAACHPDRPALCDGGTSSSYAEVASLSARGGALVRGRQASHLVHLGRDGADVVVALFAAAAADVPFVPIDPRLPFDLVRARLAGLDRPLVIADESHVDEARAAGLDVVVADRFLAESAAFALVESPPCFDDEETAVIFFGEDDGSDEGTAVSHRELVAPVSETLELAAAPTDEPAHGLGPHHQVAGLVARLASIHVGRPIIVSTPHAGEASLVGAATGPEPTSSARADHIEERP